MKLKKIYNESMIPENLQEHIMRVAGLTKIIVESCESDSILKEELIKASLLHDIAKPLNFILEKQADFECLHKILKS